MRPPKFGTTPTLSANFTLTGLTFAFGFGNVWATDQPLNAPAFITALDGTAVDRCAVINFVDDVGRNP